MLALLRFVENPRDRDAGFRVMQLMPGVGPTSAQRVLDRMNPIGALAGRAGGDLTLRTLVTPGLEFLPLSAKTGEGAPPRHHQLAALGLVSDNRSRVIREDPVQRWQIACPVAPPANSRIACWPFVTE